MYIMSMLLHALVLTNRIRHDTDDKSDNCYWAFIGENFLSLAPF